MKNQNSTLSRFLLGGCAFIIIVVPFHALFTAWLASAVGHFDLVRLWKEFLLLALVVAAIATLIKDEKLRKEIVSSKLIRISALFLILVAVMAKVGFLMGDVSLNAAAYGTVIDARFLVFMIVVLIAARKAGTVKEWPLWVLVPAGIVVLYGILQLAVLPNDFLRHFGYGPKTLEAYQNVDNKPGLSRLQSTLRGPNPLGAYLVAVIILFLAYIRRRIPSYRLAAYGAVTLSVVVLYATYSRSAYIGLFVAGICYAFLSLKEARSRKLFWYITLGLVVICSVVIVALRDNDTVQNVVFHTNEHSSSPTSSNFQRSAALKQGVLDIAHKPLGGGVGSAGPASLRNTKAPARISENFFLQIGQETGVIGLGLFMAILAILLRRLWSQRDLLISRALLAIFIGLIAINLVSHAWADDTLAYVFFGSVGFALTGAKTVQKAKKRAKI